MRLPKLSALLVPGVLAVSGCGDGTGPADEEMVQFVGAWRATKFEYVSHINSDARVNLASLGASVTLTINSGGAWTLLITRPGLIRYDVSTGNMSVDGDKVVFVWNGYEQPMTFVYDLSEDALSMSTSEAQYDFDTDGADEPADLEMVLLRL